MFCSSACITCTEFLCNTNSGLWNELKILERKELTCSIQLGLLGPNHEGILKKNVPSWAPFLFKPFGEQCHFWVDFSCTCLWALTAQFSPPRWAGVPGSVPRWRCPGHCCQELRLCVAFPYAWDHHSSRNGGNQSLPTAGYFGLQQCAQEDVCDWWVPSWWILSPFLSAIYFYTLTFSSVYIQMLSAIHMPSHGYYVSNTNTQSFPLSLSLVFILSCIQQWELATLCQGPSLVFPSSGL